MSSPFGGLLRSRKKGASQSFTGLVVGFEENGSDAEPPRPKHLMMQGFPRSWGDEEAPKLRWTGVASSTLRQTLQPQRSLNPIQKPQQVVLLFPGFLSIHI